MTVIERSATIDFAVVRAFVADQLAGAGINAYAYPDPQVEYPALVLPMFDGVDLYASVGGGEVVTWRAEVLVEAPEPETGVAALEQLVVGIAYALGDLTAPTPYARLFCRRIENVRAQQGAGAISADLLLELHA